MRIAMWSGPRNISTAMMYAFGNRSDFSVWDEPFYAAYLKVSGVDHPLRSEVVKHHESDPLRVSKACTGSIPDGKQNFYMKHMALHMLDGFALDWANECVNVHLIRHPARVIASYAEKRQNPNLRDIGFREQVQLFRRFPGPVLDSSDIRADPEGMLKSLCDAIGLEFDQSMLSWQAGPKPFDGVWASHWYGSVHRSTGFAGPENKIPLLKGALGKLLEEALPFYEQLAAFRLQ